MDHPVISQHAVTCLNLFLSAGPDRGLRGHEGGQVPGPGHDCGGQLLQPAGGHVQGPRLGALQRGLG